MGSKISLHKIYSTDGIELDSLLFEPTKKTHKIVVHVHGKEGHFVQNHFVSVFGELYPKYNYSFLSFNNRGHDYMADLLKKTSTGYIWEQGGSMYEMVEKAQYDIEGVIAYVQKLGYTDITLQGHSLGPHKICYYATHSNNHPVSKFIFLTTADVRYQFDTSIPEWEKHSLIAKRMIDEGKGKELMSVKLWSNCPISAESFWNYTKPHNNCFVFNGTHPENEFVNFNKVALPILVVNPENDVATGINPYEFIKILKDKSVSKDFEAHVIANSVHNFLSKEQDLAEVVLQWLKRREK